MDLSRTLHEGMCMNRTGYIYREEYMWHNTGIAAAYLSAGGYIQPDLQHAESSDSKRRINGLISVSGIRQHLHIMDDFKGLTDDQITLFHTKDYIRNIKTMSDDRGGDAGELTPFGPGSYEIATLSAAGPLVAGRALLSGKLDNAYVLNRPPGHHAEADRGRGFCLLANGVLAAMNLRREFGDLRIAILDWDVHHGNGTQKAFWTDPTTLVMSIHQYQNYPQESGFVDEIGEEDGRGYNINVPMPPGSGHGAYLHAIDTVVGPAIEAFKPDLIMILSGFDGCIIDPLGRNMAYSETYREMTLRMMSLADRLCNGKLLVMHEGGYSAAYTPFCGLAVLESLTGAHTGVEDPFREIFSGYGMQDLQPHQAEMIAKSAEVAKLIK
ncbi:class II histone deacetylase [Halomonas cupida]|uniref:class II histone deacetylase n=1 Tax=Halomonas cupida TaxID=44933 RepID=UPI003A93E568